MILIQRITTEWTKESRGGRGATVRNSFPEALPVLPCEESPGTLLVHSVRFREWDDFQCREELIHYDSAVNAPIEPLRINPQDYYLAVRFVWDWTHCGAPERASHDIFHLQLGQWGRFSCNGRFGPTSSSGCLWLYHKSVFNIALIDSLDTHLFVSSEPRSVQDRLAILK